MRPSDCLLLAPLLLVACGSSSESGPGPVHSQDGGGDAVSAPSDSGDSAAQTDGGNDATVPPDAPADAGDATSSGNDGGEGGSAVDPTYLVDLKLPNPTSLPAFPQVTVYLDVPYGTHPQQRFDIVLPDSGAPTPLIVFIHGGGFVDGDKAIKNSPELQQTVGSGIAYASLNYRLLADTDSEGVIKPLTDCKRALQFLRYHAAGLNIDPANVALQGGSAGAGTSLWIGTHDDMAGNADAVDKMTTRVVAVAAHATQATYDLMKWETVVFADYGIKLLDKVQALGMEQRLLSFYGVGSASELSTPALQAYRAEVDMLAHMSADDPPVYVHNPLMTTTEPMDENELYHHGNHAKAVNAQAAASGLEVTAVVEAFGVDESAGVDEWSFLAGKLGK